ncbi:Nad dependent epimerase dehydratase [Paragonimus skrjabini miyazakii]|uniref:Nad dependent epimerase dehydratase n=1 Tax=Paragonimus skrjabini miyazakii TaxID=59628 RepID=A0A8S9YYA0_9TREM|nr:Nad dependent epimerase dehydratase [Paragonimus skrjabini miyazakii]
MTVSEGSKVDARGPLLVIGAGFGRTGTKSLKTALEIIYGQPCYHMFELVAKHRDDSRKWVEVDRLVSESTDGKIDPGLFYEMFDGYRCTVDFPSSSYYPQLMQAYPDAKVVLTIRDKQSWLESVRSTILLRRDIRHYDWAEKLIVGYQNGWHFLSMNRTMLERVFGPGADATSDKMVLAAYDRWIAQVTKDVPADRLLVFHVREGWEPLCKFLNVPVPNQPFPNVNERAELVKRIEFRRKLVRLTRWGLRFMFGVIVAFLLYRLI